MSKKAATDPFSGYLSSLTPRRKLTILFRLMGTMALFVAMYHLVGWWGVLAVWGWKMQESLRREP